MKDPHINHRQQFDGLTSSLLKAAGHKDLHVGAGLTLPHLIACLEAAAQAWPEAPIGSWLMDLKEEHRSGKQALKDGKANAVAMYQQSERRETTLWTIQNWSPCTRPGDKAHRWDAVLGRALILAAHHGSIVHPEFLAGLRTLTLTRTGKGRRSGDWDRLIDVDLSSQKEVIAYFETISSNCPARPFVSHLIATLQAPIRDAEVHNSDRTRSTDEHGDSTISDEAEDDLPVEQAGKNEGGSRRSSFASVASRLAEANYSSPAEKLGIHSRDYLLLGDLQLITKQLPALIGSPDKEIRAHSVLALICLATASSDYQVINIPLSPIGDGLWLDLDVGSWCWDFASYRLGLDRQKVVEVEPVFVPLPLILWDALKEARSLSTNANTVLELINNVIGGETVNLKKYRLFLRSLGDTAHPAYQARTSRSMVNAMLEITASDMLTALTTARFSSVAPAALFYFHPTPTHIHTQVSKVFEALGLGWTTTPPQRPGAKGQSRPDANSIQTGWAALMSEITQQLLLARTATTPEVMLGAVNKCMVSLCAAFVIQTGHRGTRLENLTADCLLGSPDVMVIHDKDDTTEKGRDRPRALPVRPVVQAILNLALEIHRLMGTATEHRKGVSISAKTWVFARFDTEGQATHWVEPNQIAELMANHFEGASTNWARSMWITQLDEASCDRWLIRTLSGHTRDVTRTGDAYFDVPIHVACQRLGRAMDSLGSALFGSPPAPTDELAVNVVFDWTPSPIAVRPSGPPGVPDPRALLQPLSGRVLVAADVAYRIRHALAQGELQVSPSAKAVLHLLFVELIPEPSAALRIGDAGAIWVDIGAPCLTWTREHFVHQYVYPMSLVTYHWIQLSMTTGFNAQSALCEIDKAMSELGLRGAQSTSADNIWELCTEWAAAYRRLHLPPSLQAAAHPQVPAPTLSRDSLMRLSGQAHSTEKPKLGLKFSPAKMRQSKGEDIRNLGKILNHWSDHDRRLGELRARALGAMSAINELQVEWTPGGVWVLDWLKDELARSSANVQNHYQISSLHTYFSALTRAPQGLFDSDPYEWDQSDWDDYLQALAGNINLADSALPETTRNAIAAIASSLSRRGDYIPHTVRATLFKAADKPLPEDSASSVYIGGPNIADAITNITQNLADTPSIAHLARARGLLSSAIPLRTSDLSSLMRDCITPAGGLVIKRVGFNSHKTESTIRVVQLTIDQVSSLRDCRAMIINHVGPQGDLLMRHDGKDWGVQQDNAATRAWSEGLKVSTGSPAARPHSVRASTLQGLVWPHWDLSAQKLLLGKLTVVQAQLVTSGWQQNWVGMASGSAMAGHADIRAALGNYLSPWPLVHAVYARALLSGVGPGPDLLHQLGLSRDAFRQAKHRASQQDGNAMHFDAWEWIEQRLTGASTQGRALPTIDLQPVSPADDTPSNPPSSIHSVDVDVEIKYLTLRILGVSSELAATGLDVPWSMAMQFEAKLQVTDISGQIQQRTKGAAGARGLVADVKTCNGPTGTSLRTWLRGLTKAQLELATVALNRDMECPSGYWHRAHNWAGISASLPDEVVMHIAKGAAYTTTEEFSKAASAGTRYRLTADKKLGIRPKVSIWPKDGNRVLAARITAVARVTALVMYRLKGPTNGN